MTEPRDELIGSLVLGRYRVVQAFAQGGMGAVYLARVEGSAGFAKPAVVKRVLPHLNQGQDGQEQFIREARILSNLRHPGIVGVVDFGEEHGSLLMVLDYVHGYNLGQWLKYLSMRHRVLPWELAALIVLRVLAALHYAHTLTRSDGSKSEIIHRDISPGNIVLDVDGNVRLLDFGIALMAQDPGGYKTQDGTFKGKLSYASPEIFSGAKASPKSDVYATGVVLYQLLTGSNPFATKEISETVRRVLTVEPAPVRSTRGDVPPALSRIVAKAMSKKPTGRYATAEAFAHDLRRALIRREDQIFGELRDRVRSDFLGEMADAIGAWSLHELDAAWQRSIRPPTEHAPLRSSIRPQIAEQPTIDVRVHRDISQQLTTIERAPAPQPSNRRSVLAVVAAIVLTGGVTTAAILLTRASAPAPAQRFLVVQAADGTAPGTPVRAVSPSAAALPSTPSSASAAAAGGRGVPSAAPENQPGGSKTAPLSGGDDAVKLSRKFSERRGAVQQCFQAHTLVLEGTPNIGIRFQVDAAGHVTSASIQPGDLASTALGQCLLGVARSTKFGPQPEARAFTIPIRARAVK